MLFRSSLAAEGKNPFILDSKAPTKDYKEFLMSEVRYASLKLGFPDIADQLFEQAAQEARERYETYKAMAEMGPVPVKA